MPDLSILGFKKIYELMVEYEKEKIILESDPGTSVGDMHALDRTTLLEIRSILGISRFKLKKEYLEKLLEES